MPRVLFLTKFDAISENHCAMIVWSLSVQPFFSSRAYRAFEAINLNGKLQDACLNGYVYGEAGQKAYQTVWLRHLGRQAANERCGTKEAICDFGLLAKGRLCRSAFVALEFPRATVKSYATGTLANVAVDVGSGLSPMTALRALTVTAMANFAIPELLLGRGHTHTHQASDIFEPDSVLAHLNDVAGVIDRSSRSGLLGYLPEVKLVAMAHDYHLKGQSKRANICLVAAMLGRASLQPARLLVSAYTVSVVGVLTAAHLLCALSLAIVAEASSRVLSGLSEVAMPWRRSLFDLSNTLHAAALARIGRQALAPRLSKGGLELFRGRSTQEQICLTALGLTAALRPLLARDSETTGRGLEKICKTASSLQDPHGLDPFLLQSKLSTGLQLYIALVHGLDAAKFFLSLLSNPIRIDFARGAYCPSKEDPFEEVKIRPVTRDEVRKRAQALGEMLVELKKKGAPTIVLEFAMAGSAAHLQRMCSQADEQDTLRRGFQVLREYVLLKINRDISPYIANSKSLGEAPYLRTFSASLPGIDLPRLPRRNDVLNLTGVEAKNAIERCAASMCKDLLDKYPPYRQSSAKLVGEEALEMANRLRIYASAQPTNTAVDATIAAADAWVKRHWGLDRRTERKSVTKTSDRKVVVVA